MLRRASRGFATNGQESKSKRAFAKWLSIGILGGTSYVLIDGYRKSLLTPESPPHPLEKKLSDIQSLTPAQPFPEVEQLPVVEEKVDPELPTIEETPVQEPVEVMVETQESQQEVDETPSKVELVQAEPFEFVNETPPYVEDLDNASEDIQVLRRQIENLYKVVFSIGEDQALKQKYLEELAKQVIEQQEKLRMQEEQKDKMLKALKLAGLAIDLQKVLNEEMGSVHPILIAWKKGFQDMEGFRERWTNTVKDNYQYLTETGIPSTKCLDNLLSQCQSRVRLACLLQQAPPTWWGYTKSVLASYLTKNFHDIDQQHTLSRMRLAEQLLKKKKYGQAADVLDGLRGMPREEVQALLKGLKVRQSMEDLLSNLSHQFKLLLLNF